MNANSDLQQQPPSDDCSSSSLPFQNLHQFSVDRDFIKESSPETDCLSVISDYSEMGFQIKQSIKFTDVIMSTYADLKNPNKSIVKLTACDSNNEKDTRKCNMLSLAMEFARWKEKEEELTRQNQVDSTLGDSISEEDGCFLTNMGGGVGRIPSGGSIWSGEDLDEGSILSSPRLPQPSSSVMPSKLSNGEALTATGTAVEQQIGATSPLRAHTDFKFETCFHKSYHHPHPHSHPQRPVQLVPDEMITSNYNTDDIYDENEIIETPVSSTSSSTSSDLNDRSKPAWARILFQQEVMRRMPQEVTAKAMKIYKFDLQNSHSLNQLNNSELQIIINCLFTQIEELNETLVASLIIRDELKSQQVELVNTTEKLTLSANQISRQIYSQQNSQHTHPKQSSLVYRFFHSILTSPKAATNKIMSLFSTSYQHTPLPAPEYV